MLKNYKILFFVLFAILSNKGYSQVNYGGTPPSFNDKSITERIEIREFDKPDMNKIMAEDSTRAIKGVMYRVGVSVPINLNMENSGTWTSLSDGRSLWRLTIKSADARAIAVYYDKFYLPKGSELFLYNKRKTQVIGAFTHLSNPESGYFSTELIQGDEVTFEYVSSQTSIANAIINISEISYAYRGVDHLFPSINKSTSFGQSDYCEVNVNCSEGNNWQNQKRGVAEMFTTSNSGQGWCSGSLVNNTANNCNPYFLSAYHCWDYATTYQMHQWQFYFNFESTGCPNPSYSPNYNTITGCTFISDGSITTGSDFLLVHLDQTVPSTYNPFFNGWSKSTTGSPSGVGIHHPMGDIKKISTYTSTLVSTAYGQSPNTHWGVFWIGTANGHGITEGGSSGSPIFNNAGLVVGTLSGGSSYCNNPNGYDFYGKMSYHWASNGTTSNKQLAPWLDPGNTNVTTLTGINYCVPCVTPAAPSNVSANPSSIVCGASSDLTAVSSGNTIKWYSAATGGTLFGSSASGVSFNVSPSITTTYYAETFSTCSSLARVSVQVVVSTGSPSSPTNVIASPDSICVGASSTLSATTSVGLIQWWTAQTGGTLLGTTVSGGQIVVQPTVTTSYYLRTLTSCGVSLFDSLTIVIVIPQPLSGVTVSPNNSSCGIPVDLNDTISINNIIWWDSLTGGNIIGSSAYGGNFTVYPSVTTTYYAEDANQCLNNTRTSITVTVAPLSVTFNNNNFSICSGSSVGISGTSAGNLIRWWDMPTGGQLLNTSMNNVVLSISPTTTTTYYAEAVISSLQNLTFSYTGSTQNWVVPQGITSINIDVRGAQGFSSPFGTGGLGGRVETILSVTPGQTLNINVGQAGLSNNTGGWNGGAGNTNYGGGMGGGATDIRIGGITLSDRVVVAGGGGGAAGILGGSGYTSGINGGDGGGIIGGNGFLSGTSGGYGGTFNAGGMGGSYSGYINGSIGALGIGGIANAGNAGAGGGGGYYGGGGGCWGGGGGGSSWTNTLYASNTIHTQGYQAGDGQLIISWNVFSCLSVRDSVNITVITTSSIAPNSVSISPTVVCLNDSATLTATGGTLATDANWYWYTDSCGGTLQGTGVILSIVPTSTTNYYVRAEGVCNTTSCISSIITVSVNSSSVDSISSSQNPICSGATTILNINGGNLGTASDWYWYSGSCGGISEGNGISYTANPTITSNYFVRAEGLCNTTTCVSISITLNIESVNVDSLSASQSLICYGSSTTLNISGGSLGTLSDWYWYSGSCGGSLVASGISVNTTPTLTTTYFIRAEGLCNTTSCLSLSIIVNSNSIDATSASGSALTICSGLTTTLNVSGGSLGMGANWNWYSNSCGGNYVKSGLSPIVTPVFTTTYYVRAENLCNTTSCVSITIDVIQLPSMPSVINGNNIPVNGNTETYNITNVSGITYTWSAPSAWVGASTSNSITYTVGATNGILSVIPNNTCGAGVGISIIIGTGGYQISGNFTYDNTMQTPLDSIMVYLMYNGSKVDSIQATTLGYYQFNNIPDGAYNVTATTNKAWGGVNITDAVLAKKHYAGSTLLNSSIRLHAADANLTYAINVTDAIKLSRRYAGSDTSFARGNWVFEKALGGDSLNVSTYLNDTVIVTGTDVVQDFKGICVGDVNGSYNSIPIGNKSLKANLPNTKFDLRLKKRKE